MQGNIEHNTVTINNTAQICL